MAIANKSLILYGLQITPLNSSLDFQIASLGPVLQATLNVGSYSLTTLLDEVVRALTAADNTNIYSTSSIRTAMGGLENRSTITTGGSYLSLLFGSGPRVASSVGPTLGFTATDKTGATSYTTEGTAGTAFLTRYPPFNYVGPGDDVQVQGSVSISASGQKESVSFSLMNFISCEYKHEFSAVKDSTWAPFISWAIQQQLFEITPDWTLPNTVYQVTFDKTAKDGKGLGHAWKEELPLMPGLWTTQPLTLRVLAEATAFSL